MEIQEMAIKTQTHKYTIEVFYNGEPYIRDFIHFYSDKNSSEITFEDFKNKVPNVENVNFYGTLFNGHVFPIKYE